MHRPDYSRFHTTPDFVLELIHVAIETHRCREDNASVASA